MNHNFPLPDISPKLNPIERILIWLSGAEENCLGKCPKWEKEEYEAFGASVLVPVSFGMIGSSYAISTLTDNLAIIIGFSLIWGSIILTIDRVLLATYRAFTSTSKKLVQFVLRMAVAVLMGLTVSHPLTLLLFKDTITSEIEKQRSREITVIREEAVDSKKGIEERIMGAALNLEQLQKKYQETISGDFVTSKSIPDNPQAGTPETNQFSDIDVQLKELKNERESVREGLEKWQATYDKEVGGERGGSPGVGPKARAIEKDHLVWRREEMARLNQVISEVTSKRLSLSSSLMQKSAADNEAINALKRDLEKQKLDMFANQQGQLVDVIKDQIKSSSSELDRLRGEAKQLSTDTQDRIAGLKVERRADMMTQTVILHHIFEDPANGGHFALMVYIIIASLFTLIDTLPLVVKFFSVAGPYDMVQHIEGAKYTPFHSLDVEMDSEEFEKRQFAFRKQMQARIDMFRDVDSYWGRNVPVLPREGTVESPAEVKSLVAESDREKAIGDEAPPGGKAKPIESITEAPALPESEGPVGFGSFIDRKKVNLSESDGIAEVEQKTNEVSETVPATKKTAVTDKATGQTPKSPEAPTAKPAPVAKAAVTRRPTVLKRPRQKVVLRRTGKQSIANITKDESGKGDDDIALSS